MEKGGVSAENPDKNNDVDVFKKHLSLPDGTAEEQGKPKENTGERMGKNNLLIDLTDDDNSGCMESPPNQDDKLCGWLLLVTKGLIKSNKQYRFCVFGDSRCRLYIYRGQNDLVPIEEIDIARASFHFVTRDANKQSCFQISANGKDYLLEAADKRNMMFWLKELQKRRRTFVVQKNHLSRDRMSQRSIRKPSHGAGLTSPDKSLSVEGGVSSDSESPSHVSENLSAQPLIKNAHKPPSFLGISTTEEKEKWSTNSPSPASSQEDFTIVDAKEVHQNTSSYQLQSPMKTSAKTAMKFKSAFENFKNMKIRRKPSLETDEGVTIPACLQCRQLAEKVGLLQNENSCLEDELSANRDMVRLFKKELDFEKRQLETRLQCANIGNVEEVLSKKDKHIVELDHSMAALHEERAIQDQKMKALETQVQEANEQRCMFEEMLKAKDQTIISLTTSLMNAENSGQGHTDTENSEVNSVPTPYRVEKEMQQLRAQIEENELHIQFLTDENIALNDLRQYAEDQNKRLVMENAKLEADYFHTKSRYLYLLQEYKKPMRGGANQEGEEEQNSQDVINQLLDEAITSDDFDDFDSKTLDIQFTASGKEYDKYGFVRHFIHVDEEEVDPLTLNAAKFERQSEELGNKIVQVQDHSFTSHRVKWENYMANLSGRPLQRSLELKALIRQGIPHEHRNQIWRGCINFYVGALRQKLGKDHYKNLIQKSTEVPQDPSTKQIELDLLRTLPNNKHFENSDCEGISKLRNVLVAYSMHDRLIGYCQGLNRLAAIGLLYLTEEETFWLLVAITDHLMPKDYYSKTLIAAQADQRVLKDLIQEKIPRLSAHLEHYNVDLSLFTFNWFLTVFVDNIPPETFMRIWDAYLYEGSKVLFRFAIAFFKHAEDDLLKCREQTDINRFLRCVGEKMVDIKELTHLAYTWVNPFRLRPITAKRQMYLHQLENELKELDKLRQDIRSQHKLPTEEYDSDED